MISGCLVETVLRYSFWRLFYEAIPLGLNLFWRHINIDVCYYRCNSPTESSIRAFFICKVPKETWKLMELIWDIFKKLVHGSLRVSTKVFCLFGVVLWCLWNHRNTVLHPLLNMLDNILLSWTQLKLHKMCPQVERFNRGSKNGKSHPLVL